MAMLTFDVHTVILEKFYLHTTVIDNNMLEVYIETPFSFTLIHPKANIKIISSDAVRLVFEPSDFLLRLHYENGYIDIRYNHRTDTFEVGEQVFNELDMDEDEDEEDEDEEGEDDDIS